MVRKGYGMLKALLVITSLVFCAGALFAPPPTAQDAAEWSGVVLRYANHWGRSAASVIVGALPSSAEVVGYLEKTVKKNVKKTGLLPESFANALGDVSESKQPAPEPARSAATPECRLRELDELFRQEHVQEYVRENVRGTGQESPGWTSHEDIPCAPDAEPPRPWCDPKVQAVLRLLEEDRARRGQSAPSLCNEGPSPSPALRN